MQSASALFCRWYADVVAAAEQAHRHKMIGKAASQKRHSAGATAAAGADASGPEAAVATGSKARVASSFAQTLQAPIKVRL